MRKVYNLYYLILYPLFKIRYRFKCIGKEKIPSGAALVCANHSSMADPLIVALAFTREHYLHFMAKIELTKFPGLRFITEKAGSFFIDRGISDVVAIKTMIKYLKADEKVMMFPEGTRVSEDDAVAAKNGAVRIAARTGAPLLPVYIPRKKPLLRRTCIVVGEPYYVTQPENKAETSEYFRNVSNELMQRIHALQVYAK